ncbi:ATP phosphoribosyltransferase regulatory subunit [Caldimonas brevitalea]|uniref:ATP phosphoribosyltransferase regulatory subunit n=1 Tax=Caldimonas brevitalea TaxID=413882 RepID=A0A0G3BR05_9BURK|nr:ATP phosphoribosyltransferase regulatory subunit [Caldimonas brevitalea]AKJ28990.1 ATP phosphoribosyltransferase regulatory subunit [Caldimonas brevitalea]
MSSAWLLPEHIADVLPSEARRIEELRRTLLDVARSYGYELVMPPLLEYLESLLSGTGRALDLRTFKLVDQLSGRTMGVRADTTPQVARIDAHLLNRKGVTRLCYCGPVLHTTPSGLQATREPLQFGAEIYGHAGLEADLEAQELALEGLQRLGLGPLILDLADTRIVRALLTGVPVDAVVLDQLYTALAAKDNAVLAELTRDFPADSRAGLLTLTRLYGDAEVLAEAERVLPAHPGIQASLADLRWLVDRIRYAHPDVRIGFDFADLSGYAYYSGARFAIYAAGCSDALVRGGRYDEVGAVFGRNRPAAGFSTDLKELAGLARVQGTRAAIRAPWGQDESLRQVIRRLREQGETVVCVLPGHEHEVQEFECDRELVSANGQWAVQPL